MTRVIGVDGCPGGWVGALVGGDGDVAWRILSDAAAIVSVGAEVTAIDIPIGLPETGERDCDVAARRLLGRRAAAVFPAPPRAVVAAVERYGGPGSLPSHAEICRIARDATGRAISVQTWRLLPRIADVDRVMTPARQRDTVEVHPEVSFALLAGTPLPSKRTAAGRAARLAALGRWLPDPGAALAAAPRPAKADDALDALAAAWSAQRRRAGTAVVLPGGDPPRDARGLRMEIVA